MPGTASAWTWPSDGAVLRAFAFDRDHPYAAGQHRGIDVGGAVGAPVVAPAGGVVSFSGTTPGNGLTLSIRTKDGYTVTLTHLGSLGAQAADHVDEAAQVATIGSSGTSEVDVPYVHLGIRSTADDNGYVDPLSLLPFRTPAPSVAPPPPPAPQTDTGSPDPQPAAAAPAVEPSAPPAAQADPPQPEAVTATPSPPPAPPYPGEPPPGVLPRERLPIPPAIHVRTTPASPGDSYRPAPAQAPRSRQPRHPARSAEERRPGAGRTLRVEPVAERWRAPAAHGRHFDRTIVRGPQGALPPSAAPAASRGPSGGF